ncbi:MAG: LapA family protein [Fulvimonas sp.]|nr:LapA family protein [Aerosticca soli]MDI3261202.1 LapA family protein [Fulvimonas sp.]
MRWLVLLILILAAAAGVAVGALNATLVDYDLGFAVVRWPKGAVLLVALVIGWLLGGLTAWLGMRLQRRNRTPKDGRRRRAATSA